MSSLDEVIEVLTASGRESQTVRPQGGGGWLGAWGIEGAAPGEPDVRLDLSGLDEVVEYEPADLTMTVGAGVTLDRIAELARPNQQWLALDPQSAAGSTIGATVATASGGALRSGFSGPRDHVLGVTLVTGDGRLLELGGRVVKNVAGFDLLKLMVGGWGRFGVITQVTVRLHPLPVRDITLVYEADDPAHLAAVARAVATASIVPAALRLALDLQGPGQLAVRVVGGEASAPVEADVLEAAGSAQGGAARREEGATSAKLWATQQRTPAEEATELALFFTPSELPGLVPAIVSARAAGWRVRCDVTEGLCAVDGIDAPTAPITEWTTAGASLRILKGTEEARQRLQPSEASSDEVVQGLVGRLTKAFDPGGVLG